MQKVRFLSSLTYECTQVTPSSLLLATTLMHAFAPVASIGMTSPSGKVRSTRYRGMRSLRSRPRWTCADRRRAARGLHREGSLFLAGALPILGEEAVALRR